MYFMCILCYTFTSHSQRAVAAFPRFADARQRFAIIRDSAAATGGNAFVSGWLSVEDDVND